MIVSESDTPIPSVQHTIARPICLKGRGVHGNQEAKLVLLPAPAHNGIVFGCIGEDGDRTDLRARHDFVGSTEMCTILGDPEGVFVATIEHLIAALCALNIDNLYIEVTGPEVPVMDGSSDVFVSEISKAGVIAQAARREYIRIDHPIRVKMGDGWAEFLPDDRRILDIEIDFADPAIGNQRYIQSLDSKNFCDDVLKARTFGFMRDVESLWKAGYALGSSFENSVVIGEEGIMNPEGLRYDDEFVRHKMLDAVGDLALMGAPFIGRFRSYRGGHKLNFMMVEKIMQEKECWSYHKFGRMGSVPVAPALGASTGAIAAAPNS